MTEGFLPIDDTTLFYRRCGKGAPLLLLHGNGEDTSCFDAMIPTLCEHFDLILLDTRGHGKSGWGTKPLNFSRIAEDIRDFLAALSIPQAHILGFSDGGNAALYLGLTAPTVIKSLTLVGANLSPSGMRLSTRLLTELVNLLYTAAAMFRASAAQRRDIWRLMIHSPHLSAVQLKQIAVPTLVVAGENDCIKRSETQTIADAIPNAKMEIVPKANHFLPQQYPEQLCALLLKFLSAYQD